MTDPIRGTNWAGYPDRQITADPHDDRLHLNLTELPDESVGADEIFLDADHAGRLMLAIAAWLADRLRRENASLPEDQRRGGTVYGFIGLNNAGDPCLFTSSLADGIKLTGPGWEQRIFEAEYVPRRLTTYHLQALDPSDPE